MLTSTLLDRSIAPNSDKGSQSEDALRGLRQQLPVAAALAVNRAGICTMWIYVV